MADTTSPLTAPIGKQLPADLSLTPLVDGAAGQARPLMEWLTTFHLASVILDPYTNESSWILRAATRILEPFRGSDARINLIVTSGPSDAQAFLGPLTERFLVFCDADRSAVKAIGLSRAPGVRVHPRRRRGRGVRAGLEPARVGRSGRCHRRDHLVVVDHGAGPERSGPVPRFAGPRLTSRSRAGATAGGRAAVPRSPRHPRDLPIVDALDDVRAALREHRRAIIVAPPGAGKTTVVPLALLDEPWLGDGRIVMLEPRRLATRAAAQRMAATTRTASATLIGYQTRESATSARRRGSRWSPRAC